MKDRPMTLCGKALDGVLHVCAFMESRTQQNEILLPFLKEGRAAGDRLLMFVDPKQREDQHAWLRRSGLDIEGQLDLVSTSEANTKSARVSADKLLDLLSDQLAASRPAGFPGLRGVIDMHWATGLEDELLEFHARLMDIVRKHDDPIVCVYDVNQFGGRVLLDVMATHELVVLGSRIYENEYFVSPRRYLAQRQKRRDTRK